MSDERANGRAGEQPPSLPSRPESAASAVTWQVRVAAAWCWRLLLIGVVIYILLRIFQRIELVAFSFIISIFFAAVLHPLEKQFRRIPGHHRWLSALLSVLIGLAVLGGIGYFVSVQVNGHSAELSKQVSDLVTNVSNYLRDGPLHLKSTDLDKITTDITNQLKNNSSTIISGAIQTVKTVFELLGALLLILLSTFFLLRDGERIWHWVLTLLPTAAHERVDVAGQVGWHTVGGYIRGQVVIALFHAVSIGIVLLVLRVPLALALAVVIFIFSFIPTFGLIVAGAFAAAVTLLEHGVTSAIIVIVAITILVQVESHLLQPLVMSRTVKVHPLSVALSVLTGTILAGIVGALLAVPLVAFVNATVHALRGNAAVPPAGNAFAALRRSKKPDAKDPPLEQAEIEEDEDAGRTGD